MEIISANKFATLHNDTTIFYSHIAVLNEVFLKINKVDHEVILICGNGDISLTNQDLPSNVKYCFAQNALIQGEKVIPIPIGLRNSFPVYIPNQSPLLSGVSFDYGIMSERKLKEIYLNDNTVSSKFLYSNFSVYSNIGYRQFLKNVCKSISYINYEDSGGESELAYDNYITKILDHEATFCPAGNGVDTHRIWEVLYCKRIPITINANVTKSIKINTNYAGESSHIPPQNDEYSIYTKLYSDLPIVILDNYHQLSDEDYLKQQIEYQKSKKSNLNLLDFNFWKDMILDLEKTLSK